MWLDNEAAEEFTTKQNDVELKKKSEKKEKQAKNNNNKKRVATSEESESESEFESDMEEDEEGEDDENSEMMDEDEEDEDDSDEEMDEDEEDGDEDNEDEEEEEDEMTRVAREKGLKEDIYGRLVDKTGKVVELETGRKRASERLQELLESSQQQQQQKTTTPTMGSTTMNNGGDSQQQVKLSKQMQGLFNRLSTANMYSISNQIIQIFYSNEYTRHDIIATILRLLTTSLIRSNCLSPTRLVLEHAALIFVLTNQVGIELGASLVQKLCTRLDAELNALSSNDIFAIDNKTADNLVLLLCNLYNFKLFSANLIIDLLNKTLADKIDADSMR